MIMIVMMMVKMVTDSYPSDGDDHGVDDNDGLDDVDDVDDADAADGADADLQGKC